MLHEIEDQNSFIRIQSICLMRTIGLCLFLATASLPGNCPAENGWKVEDLGIPVQAVTYGNSHAALAPGPDGKGSMFYTSYYCTTGTELIGYDYKSGTLLRQKLPSNGGYGLVAGPDGAIYVGGVYPGDLYRYHPTGGKLSTIDVKQFGVQYIWDAAAGDGWIYCAAGYPRTKLVGFEIANGKAMDLGEMAPGEQYLRAVCVDIRGNVWCGTGTRAHLIVRAPDGGLREALPPDLATNSLVAPVRAIGKFVVAIVNFDGVALVYDVEAANQAPLRIPLPERSMGWEIVQGGSGSTGYLQNAITHDLYRCDLRAGKMRLMAKAVGQAKIIEENRWVHAMDDQDYVVYDLDTAKVIARKRLKEGGDGMQIYTLTSGADGDIYGSTYINMRLFRYSSSAGLLTDLGKASRWPGQIDSLSLGSDGRLYIGAYIHAVLSVYDPKLPWSPGPQPGDNPLEIGPLGKGQYRTRANCLGPDGRIYAGSIPSYNSSTVGAFSICDPKTHHMDVRTDFVKGGAVDTLVADDACVYGAGGGEFFVYDPKKGEKRFRQERPCVSLAVLGGGKVVGSGGGQVFIYDRQQNRIVAERANPHRDLPRMAAAEPGIVFGVNTSHVVRITESPFAIDLVAAEGGAFAAVDKAGRVYFARGARLLRCSPASKN